MAAAIDELARVRARTFADGELGVATAVVLVIKLGRGYNWVSFMGEPLSKQSSQFTSTLVLFVMKSLCKW